jgi:hypothetical protein
MRLVSAHLGKLADLLDFNRLVLFASDLVEKVRVLGKVLIGEVVLNLLTVSWEWMCVDEKQWNLPASQFRLLEDALHVVVLEGRLWLEH